MAGPHLGSTPIRRTRRRARLVVDRKAIVAFTRMAAIEHVVRKVGQDILDEAKSKVPVDTGTLRDSGTLEVGIERSNFVIPGVTSIDVVTARVGFTTSGDGKFYAPFVELGTRTMRAQPFLRPAAYKQRRIV